MRDVGHVETAAVRTRVTRGGMGDRVWGKQQTADGRQQELQHAVTEENGKRRSARGAAADFPTAMEIGRAAKRSRPFCSTEFLPYCVL